MPASRRRSSESSARCVDPDPARRYQKTRTSRQTSTRFSGDAPDRRHCETARCRRRMAAPDPLTVAQPAVVLPTAVQPTVDHCLAAPRALAALACRRGRLPSSLPPARSDSFCATVSTGARRRRSASVPTRSASLFILPFRNASGDSSLDWLGPTAPTCCGPRSANRRRCERCRATVSPNSDRHAHRRQTPAWIRRRSTRLPG